MPRWGTIEHEKDSVRQALPLDSPPQAGNDGWLTATVSPVFQGNDGCLSAIVGPIFQRKRIRMCALYLLIGYLSANAIAAGRSDAAWNTV